MRRMNDRYERICSMNLLPDLPKLELKRLVEDAIAHEQSVVLMPREIYSDVRVLRATPFVLRSLLSHYTSPLSKTLLSTNKTSSFTFDHIRYPRMFHRSVSIDLSSDIFHRWNRFLATSFLNGEKEKRVNVNVKFTNACACRNKSGANQPSAHARYQHDDDVNQWSTYQNIDQEKNSKRKMSQTKRCSRGKFLRWRE